MDKSKADMTIKASLSPHFEARLDALKLVQFKFALDTVLRSVHITTAPPSEEASTTSPLTTSPTSTSPSASLAPLEESVCETEVVESLAPEELATVDPEQTKLMLIATIPSIRLILYTTESHFAELSFWGIEYHTMQRAFDTNTFVKLNSLALKDSSRSFAHRHIVSTELDNSPEDAAPLERLVTIHQRIILNPLSPQFEGLQSEMSIVGAGLEFSFDEESTMRYAPLASSLMRHYRHYYPLPSSARPAEGSATSSTMSSRPAPTAAAAPPTTATAALHRPRARSMEIKEGGRRGLVSAAMCGGSKVTFSLMAASLTLLHTPMPVSTTTPVSMHRTSSHRSSDSSGIVSDAPSSRKFSSNSPKTPQSLSYSQSQLLFSSPPPRLEAAFKVKISDVLLETETSPGTAAGPSAGCKITRGHVRSLDVTDQRSESKDNHFKLLISKGVEGVRDITPLQSNQFQEFSFDGVKPAGFAQPSTDIGSTTGIGTDTGAGTSSTAGAGAGAETNTQRDHKSLKDPSRMKRRILLAARKVRGVLKLLNRSHSRRRPVSLARSNSNRAHYLLTISLNESAVGVSHAEVMLRDITTYVSLDVVTSLVNVVSGNMSAVEAVRAALSTGLDLPQEQPATAHQELRSHVKGDDVTVGDATGDSVPHGHDDDDDDDVPSGCDSDTDTDSDSDSDSETEGHVGMTEDLNLIAASAGDHDHQGRPTSPRKAPLRGSQFFTVQVRVLNPLLLVLKDPRDSCTKALASSCTIDLTFDQATRQQPMRNATSLLTRVVTSTQVSLSECKICLTDMEQARELKQIIAPMNVAFRTYKETRNTREVATDMTFIAGNLRSRLSLNDIGLISEILEHARAEKPAPPPLHREQYPSHTSGTPSLPSRSLPPQSSSTGIQQQATSQLAGTAAPVQSRADQGANVRDPDIFSAHQPLTRKPPTRSFSVSLMGVHAVLVNDVSDFNAPLGRLVIDDTSFTATGTDRKLAGECELNMLCDFYNSSMSAWEPVLEPWRSSISFRHDDDGAHVAFISSSLLQLNMSGALSRGIFNAMSLVARVGSKGSYSSSLNGECNPLEIRNTLGMPVILYDSKRQVELVTLDSDKIFAIKPLNPHEAQHLQVFPHLFDIHLVGSRKLNRQPIVQVSASVGKPKKYTFQPSKKLLRKLSKMSFFTAEPITEELFENSRRDTFGGWIDPKLTPDGPSRWTDRSGLKHYDSPQAFPLPNNWAWVEPEWRLDLSGKVGTEIDVEGWYYSSSFSVLQRYQLRRTHRLLDTARQRRFVRTREPVTFSSPIVTGTGEHTAAMVADAVPISIFWTVKSRPDDTRLIEISCGFDIQNNASFPIEVELLDMSGSAGKDTTLPGILTIKAGETAGVPFALALKNYLRVRPRAPDYSWSDTVLCVTQTHGNASTRVHRLRCFDQSQQHGPTRHFTINVRYSYNMMHVTCSANAEVFNWLPCSLRLLCGPKNSMDMRGEKDSSDCTTNMGAGTMTKVSHVDLYSSKVPMFLEVGQYSTELPFQYDENRRRSAVDENDQEDERTVLLSLVSPITSRKDSAWSAESDSGDSMDQISLTMRLITSKDTGVLQIVIYSKFVLVDQSGSGMVVRSSVEDTFDSDDEAAAVAVTENQQQVVSSATTLGTVRKGGKPSPHSLRDTLVKSRSIKRISCGSFQTLWDAQPGAANLCSADLAKSSSQQFEDCWADGRGGVTLFQPSLKGKISLGVNGGLSWSREICANSLGNRKTPLEIVSADGMQCHYLALRLAPLVGSMVNTMVLTVMPRFTIVNYMEEDITLVQGVDSGDGGGNSLHEPGLTVAPKATASWHGCASSSSSHSSSSQSTSVHLKCESSNLGIGSFDLNEVGTTILNLPPRERTSDGKELIVAHIEVKLSDPDAASYITVIIWRSQITRHSNGSLDSSSTGLSIKNDTELPFVIQQHDVEAAEGAQRSYFDRFNLVIPPGEWLPYGWTDPDCCHSLRLAVGTSCTFAREDEDYCVVDTRCMGTVYKLPVSLLRAVGATICVVIETVANGLVVRICKQDLPISAMECLNSSATSTHLHVVGGTYVLQHKQQQQQQHGQGLGLGPSQHQERSAIQRRRQDVYFDVFIQYIGISLIAEHPRRREFLCLHLHQLHVLSRQVKESPKEDAQHHVEWKLMDIQIDNYSETAVFPVLLNTLGYDERLKAESRRQRQEAAASAGADAGADAQVARGGSAAGAGAAGQSSSQPNGANPSSSRASSTDTSSHLEVPPFFHLSMLKYSARGTAQPPVYKYVALRVLEINVAVDSSTILLYFCDLHPDLTNRSPAIDTSDSTAMESVMQFKNEETLHKLRYQSGANVVDPDEAFYRAQGEKVFFDHFVIHPIKASLSFEVSSFPRNLKHELQKIPDQAWLASMQHVVTVEGLGLYFNSFIVRYALESRQSMVDRLVMKTSREFRKNMVTIAGSVFGSLNILGKPADLYKKLGTGVQDLFYEVNIYPRSLL